MIQKSLHWQEQGTSYFCAILTKDKKSPANVQLAHWQGDLRLNFRSVGDGNQNGEGENIILYRQLEGSVIFF